MKLTFTRTDTDEWTATTDIGDYTITHDSEIDTFTLWFLPIRVGATAKELGSGILRPTLKDQARTHYQATKGGN
jgi:hypothetical protein